MIERKIYGEKLNSKGETVYRAILVSCECGKHKSFEFDEDNQARQWAETHRAKHRFTS